MLARQSQENETHRLRVNYAQVSLPLHLCAKDNVLDAGRKCFHLSQEKRDYQCAALGSDVAGAFGLHRVLVALSNDTMLCVNVDLRIIFWELFTSIPRKNTNRKKKEIKTTIMNFFSRCLGSQDAQETLDPNSPKI